VVADFGFLGVVLGCKVEEWAEAFDDFTEDGVVFEELLSISARRRSTSRLELIWSCIWTKARTR